MVTQGEKCRGAGAAKVDILVNEVRTLERRVTSQQRPEGQTTVKQETWGQQRTLQAVGTAHVQDWK